MESGDILPQDTTTVAAGGFFREERMAFRLLICMAVTVYAGRLCAQDLDLDDLLDMDLEAFVEVVAASKTSQQPHEVPATVRVITADQIRENGYLTLEDALSDLPGFQAHNHVGYNNQVFARGIPDQNQLILLLIDGVQTNELSSGSFYSGGHYNLSNVKRIEVMYGPASSLYGTNAEVRSGPYSLKPIIDTPPCRSKPSLLARLTASLQATKQITICQAICSGSRTRSTWRLSGTCRSLVGSSGRRSGLPADCRKQIAGSRVCGWPQSRTW